MVIHYSTNGQHSACGHSGATLSSSGNTAEVSCKRCQRSLGKPVPATAAVKRATPSLAELRKPKPVAAPAQASATAPGFSVAAAWRQRLGEMNSHCRLPRSKVRQRFV
ncbi:hypothetical protein [Pseudomonas typographi]|uniref:Uncharacterized protein n=1 Tax=Pseudomonas typographi TaxID=2715964 RepID=A0ABR7Z119_9PSED|nr:hypothetical protein [Pseudomonas typographi]MBD1552283.1 hypothetical protein [Pseudomonas typographi]MBD1587403.1 hypothetical protein [Pseudomonas typographi]MBD1599102.1 hypothetical protein [Pseudomonas typographi]